MRLILFTIIFTLLAVEGSFFNYLFGGWKRDTKASTVDQGIDLAADTLKATKTTAYNTYLETQQKASDFSYSAWDTVYEGYSNAWLKYQEAKGKIYTWYLSALDKSLQLYQAAKETLKQKTKALKDYLLEYRDKSEEKFKERYWESLGRLETDEAEARRKFEQARDALYSLYEDAYNHAIEDYQTSAQYLSDATDRLKKWTESKTKGKNYEATKKKLQESREKARQYYRESLDKATQAKRKLDTFQQEWNEYSQENLNAMKLRADELKEMIKTYSENTKAKTESSYDTIMRLLNTASERATTNFRLAEAEVERVKENAKKYSEDLLASIKLKFQNLKDEL